MKSSMNCHRFATTDNELALMGRLVFNPQKALDVCHKLKKYKIEKQRPVFTNRWLLELQSTGSPDLKETCSTNLDQKLTGLFFLIKSKFFIFCFLSLLMIPNTPPIFWSTYKYQRRQWSATQTPTTGEPEPTGVCTVLTSTTGWNCAFR